MLVLFFTARTMTARARGAPHGSVRAWDGWSAREHTRDATRDGYVRTFAAATDSPLERTHELVHRVIDS